jgi:hypothetical protein
VRGCGKANETVFCPVSWISEPSRVLKNENTTSFMSHFAWRLLDWNKITIKLFEAKSVTLINQLSIFKINKETKGNKKKRKKNDKMTK